jgi:hypothetical protein
MRTGFTHSQGVPADYARPDLHIRKAGGCSVRHEATKRLAGPGLAVQLRRRCRCNTLGRNPRSCPAEWAMGTMVYCWLPNIQRDQALEVLHDSHDLA